MLPVQVRGDRLPAYLKAGHILEVRGDIVRPSNVAPARQSVQHLPQLAVRPSLAARPYWKRLSLNLRSPTRSAASRPVPTSASSRCARTASRQTSCLWRSWRPRADKRSDHQVRSAAGTLRRWMPPAVPRTKRTSSGLTCQERKAPSLWFCSLADFPCELGDNESVHLP